jgi:2'-5' RNA ligase
MRAFIALEVPEGVKDRVESAKGALEFGGVVFVRRDAMHITLEFLGEIGERDAELAAEAMRGVEFKPFRVSLRGLSYFSPGFVKVIFARVEEGASELADLYLRLGGALSRNGFGPVHGDYVPHLTVARVKGAADRKGILSALGGFAGTDFGSFRARSVVLKRSVLAREGPAYTDLFKLESGPEPSEIR